MLLLRHAGSSRLATVLRMSQDHAERMNEVMVQSSNNTESIQDGQKADEGGKTEIQNDVSEMTDSLQEGKAKAAGALRDVASMVRERAGSGQLPGMDKAAEAATRSLESGAAYLEKHTPGDMWVDLRQFCRDQPAGALVLVVLGFGLGYMVKKLVP
jgi:hypothetical protein